MKALLRPFDARFNRGYSMVELSVVLVIMSILGFLLIRTIQSNRAPVDRAEILQNIAQAQQTIEAFLLRHHRLPCASIAGDGNEACGIAQATGLPWRALGLPSNFSVMRYGVDRGLAGSVDLAAAPAASISPTLVSSYPDLGLSPTYAEYTPSNAAATQAAADAYQDSVNAAMSLTTVVNGLDWCHGLRQTVRQGFGMTVGSGGSAASVAYALAHPGMDGNFSGLNATARAMPATTYIDSPARVQAADYDDIVWAVGAAELLSRTGCNVRLAQTLAAAQEAYAAYDNIRILQQHWLMVDSSVETAVGDVQDAEVGVAMAAIGLALGVASEVQGIASAVNTEGLTAFKVVLAALNVANAIAQQVIAVQDKLDAEAALVDAKSKLDNTNLYVARVFGEAKAATDRAVRMKQKGLNP